MNVQESKARDKIKEIDAEIASLRSELDRYKNADFNGRHAKLEEMRKNGTITSGEREELREYDDFQKKTSMQARNKGKKTELEGKIKVLEAQKERIAKDLESGKEEYKGAINDLASTWKKATKGKFAVRLGAALRGKTPTKKAIAKRRFTLEQLEELTQVLRAPEYLKGGSREGKKFTDFEKIFSSKQLIDSRIEKNKGGFSR